MKKRFLIAQLARYGDCLHATTIAKQIKKDYPDSHLTWAVASRFKSILELNPYVDEIWEINTINDDYLDISWYRLEKEAEARKKNGEFDEIFYVQIHPEHWANFNGTIRHSTLAGYKKPITVSVEPVVVLSEKEINNVKEFAEKKALKKFNEVILFECSPGSNQSKVNVEFALHVSQKLIALNPDVCIIISSPGVIPESSPQIVDGSVLTFKENAELTKYCTMLIGCSSGLTWLATSDWAKKLPMIQLLDKNFFIFAGISYDFKYWGLNNEKIIEILKVSEESTIACVTRIWESDFETAKKQFHEEYLPSYSHFQNITSLLVGQKKMLSALRNVKVYHKLHKHLRIFRLFFYFLKITSRYYGSATKRRVKKAVKNFTSGHTSIKYKQ